MRPARPERRKRVRPDPIVRCIRTRTRRNRVRLRALTEISSTQVLSTQVSWTQVSWLELWSFRATAYYKHRSAAISETLQGVLTSHLSSRFSVRGLEPGGYNR